MILQALRVGTFKDSKGNEHTFSEETLKKIASGYNPENHLAPLVIGHPEHDDPAVGWVKGASYNEKTKTLDIETIDENPSFMDAYENGSYKKWSISLYPDMGIRHLGFLGAMPPAIKGLKQVSFAEGDAAHGEPMNIDFMEWDEYYRLRDIGSLFRRLRDWMIGEKDLETADRILPDYQVNRLEAPPEPKPETAEVRAALFQEQPTNPKGLSMMTPEEKAKLEAAEAAAVNFSEAAKTAEAKATAAEAKAAAAEAKLAEFAEAKVNAEIASFCEAQVKAGKMRPADVELHTANMKKLHGVDVVLEFSEGEAKITKTQLELYQANIAGAAPVVNFGEAAGRDKAPAATGAVAKAFNGVAVDPQRAAVFNEVSAIAERDGCTFEVALGKYQASK